VLPALTLVMVMTTSEIELLVIKVLDGVNVLVTIEVSSSAELLSSVELEEGVCVDVVVMTVMV